MIVNLALFEVSHPEAPPPFKGDPPNREVGDMHKVCDTVDLNKEIRRPEFVKPFVLNHRAGAFYVQARVLLFRRHQSRMLAQSEQFFYARRALNLTEDESLSVDFPIRWPATPLESLSSMGAIHPE